DTTIMLAAEGKKIDADQAFAAGLLDAVVDGDLSDEAVNFAETLLADSKGPRPTRLQPLPPRDDELLQAARARVSKRRRLEPAPMIALDAIAGAYDLPFEEALEREYALCVELLGGAESRALRHLFAAERAVKQPPGDIPARTKSRAIDAVGVVGPGGMG